MLPEIDEALTILSRHGWDRAGSAGKFWRFRHAGTGEENEMMPGEVPFWAADFLAVEAAQARKRNAPTQERLPL